MMQVLKNAGYSMDDLKNMTSENGDAIEEPKHLLDSIKDLVHDTKISRSQSALSNTHSDLTLPSIARDRAQSVPVESSPPRIRQRSTSSLDVRESQTMRSPSPYFFGDLDELKKEMKEAEEMDAKYSVQLDVLRSSKIAKPRGKNALTQKRVSELFNN
jgi:hypothetical protein